MRYPGKLQREALIVVALLISTLISGTWAGGVPEVVYPAAKYKMLEEFEAHQLQKADKAFSDKDYRLAAKLYDQFVLEYAKSKAVAYSLVRKGRCLQFDNKKYHAIKEYDEVLDYFPDDVYFATAALYFKGECYWEAQDFKQAFKAWAEIAEDEEYRKEPWAGTALKRLADNMVQNKKYDEATKYYTLVVITFRNSLDRSDLQNAIDQIVCQYVRRQPSEENFRKYYLEAKGIQLQPHNVPSNLANDWRYWAELRNRVWHFGQFKDHEKAERRRHYQYWANKLKDQYPTNDEFQIDVARMDFQATDSPVKYSQRLDEIFARGRTDENHNGRVAYWIRLFNGNQEKINEYYGKLNWNNINGKVARDAMWSLLDVQRNDLAKEVYPKINVSDLSFDERFQLLQRIWDHLRDYNMARNLFGKMDLNKENDGKKNGVAQWFWHRDGNMVLQVYDLMKDQEYADYCRMEYFQWARNWDKGIEYARKCTLVDKYASNAWWRMAEMYGEKRDWDNAVKSYRQCQNQPQNLYRIAECYKNWNKLGNAIQQLVEIENFFGAKNPAEGSKAAWVQATYYRHFGRDELENKALWKIMGKYPSSGEARPAHERLEEKGLRIKGAVDKKMWEDLRDAEKNLMNEPNL